MKKKFILLLTLTLGALASATAQSPDAKKIKLYSNILKEEEEIWIKVPFHYGAIDAAFPVLYVMDGDAHFNYITNFSAYLAHDWVYDIPEFIIVGIKSLDLEWREKLIPDYSRTAKTTHIGQNLAKFIVEELNPYIEKHYKTLPYRSIVGHSMSGTFSTYAWLAYPQFFSSSIAISPAFDNGAIRWLADVAKTNTEKYPKGRRYHLASPKNDLPNFAKKAIDWRDTLSAINLLNITTYKTYDSLLDHYTVAPVSIYEGLQILYKDWSFRLNPDTGHRLMDSLLSVQKEKFGVTYPKELLYHRLSRSMLNRKSFDRMQEVLQQWETEQPSSTYLSFYWAQYYFEKKDKAESRKHCNIALRKSKGTNSQLTENIKLLSEKIKNLGT